MSSHAFKLAICATLLFATVAPLSAQFAVRRFEHLTRFKVERGTFDICTGATFDPTTCRPTAGNWSQVSNIRSYVIPLDTATNDAALQRAISARYLPVATTRSGNASFLCVQNDSLQRAIAPLREVRASLRESTMAQAIQRTVVREAEADFRGVLRNLSIQGAARAEAETRFTAALNDSIRQNTSRSADLKWVVVGLDEADPASLGALPGIARCRSYAEQNRGWLITGVAGLVIMGSETSGDFVSSSMFQNTANLAISAATQSAPARPEVVAEASTRWSSKINTLIQTRIRAQSAEPTFHPFWVELVTLPR
jgi:hypothetical protein